MVSLFQTLFCFLSLQEAIVRAEPTQEESGGASLIIIIILAALVLSLVVGLYIQNKKFKA